MPSSVNYADIQGLVRFGYGKMAEASYLLLNIKNVAAARRWLTSAPVSSALEMKPPPTAALQVAFTREGLEKLEIRPSVIASFSSAFLSGMAGNDNRSRRLGDTGANSPQTWSWGGNGKVPHMIVMIFAESGLLDRWRKSIEGEFWELAFEEVEYLPTIVSDGREPFGFLDGISQPDLDWELSRIPPINSDQLTYTNLVCLGEFLLGYRNEYGRFTDRPLLDSREPGCGDLIEAEDHQSKKDLGLNGTYLVVRQLEQDVHGFWRFLDKVAGSNRELRYKLAEALVGRTLSNGEPLTRMRRNPVQGVGSRGDASERELDIKRNQFTFEMEGGPCPIGAHVRRANPRNADVPGENTTFISRVTHRFGFGHKDIYADLLASTRFHRLLRRGREYGKQLSPEEVLQPAPSTDSERGLHFVAINANIERQFEFVQDAWMMGTKFGGLTDESDPLLGTRLAVPGCISADGFSLPQESGLCRHIPALPQFITVRGGAYFFMPSIRALAYIARNAT